MQLFLQLHCKYTRMNPYTYIYLTTSERRLTITSSYIERKRN